MDCAQPSAALWLSAGVGGILGAAVVLARCIIWPYRMHRRH